MAIRPHRNWDPFRDLMTIQNEMNRLFGRTYGPAGTDIAEVDDARGSWHPSVDVFETPEKFSVVFELPGLKAADVEITVDEGVLTIKGERKFYSEINEDNFHRIERRFGSFARRVSLPQECDVENVSAEMKDGVLHVDVPKTERAKPKRIEIQASSN